MLNNTSASDTTSPPYKKRGHFNFAQRGHYCFGLTSNLRDVRYWARSGAIRDLAGNPAADTGSRGITVVTENGGPILRQVNMDGNRLELWFDRVLNRTTPPASAFTVLQDGVRVGVNRVWRGGGPGTGTRTVSDFGFNSRKGIYLELARPALPGEYRWRVSYDSDRAGERKISSDEEGSERAGWEFTSDPGDARSFTNLYVNNYTTVETLPVLSVADVTVTEGDDAMADFVVTLEPAATETVTVDYVTSDGTAEAGADYTAVSDTLTFSPGETQKTVSVEIVDDTVEDSGETFTLTLSNASGATLGDAEATGTILNDEEQTPAEVSIADASAVEAEGATLDFAVTMSRAQGEDVTIHYGTRSKTAKSGKDYTGTRSTFTIAAGETQAMIVVPVLEDALNEGEEYMEVWISRPSGGNVSITDNTGKGTITDSETPADISIADASAEEGPGATLDFAVTMSRAQGEDVTVHYGTRSKTAKSGEDYTGTKSTFTIAAGETQAMIVVPVLDDAHDEGEEYMEVWISRPSGGNVRITDNTARGTIINSDPMPQAWIARFGRTVAEQVIEAVQTRMQAARTPGATLQIAGQQISLSGQPQEDQVGGTPLQLKDVQIDEQDQEQGIADWVKGDTDGIDSNSTGSLTMQELLSGVSFSLVGGEGAESTPGSGLYALWGRVAENRFDGQDDEVSLDGDVTSAQLGIDWIQGDVMAGLILSHSEGDGGYQGESDQGSISSTLTGLYPWGRYQLSERFSVWGMAGYGEGDLRLDIEGQERIRTDLDLLMGAAGVVGELIQAPETGGYALAIKSDVMAVRTSTDATTGLVSAEADVTRLRLGVEGAHTRIYANGASLRPRIEIGIRHDDGDAETGFGVDVGTGISWSDPQRGVTGELSARTLLTHEDSDFEDTGISASFSWDPSPSSSLGPRLTLTQTLGGPSSGGMEALLNRNTLESLVEQDSSSSQQRQLDLSLGVGYSAGSGFIATPEVGLALSSHHREYRAGWRLDLASRRQGSLALQLDVRRAEQDSRENTEPEHMIGLRLQAGF